MLSEDTQNDSIDLVIRNIILNTVVSLEAASPYSGSSFLDILSGKKPVHYKTRAEMSDVLGVLRSALGPGICYKLLKEIFVETGFNFDLSIKLSDRRKNFTILLEEALSLEGYFPILFPVEFKSLRGTKILVIDGVVEKVSEIDSLLRSASETGETILLMSRNFHPDVINTLYQNYKKGKLSVFPYVLSCDQKVLESLSEMGIDVINSENYGSIIVKSCEDLGEKRDVRFYGGKVALSGLSGLERSVTIEIPKHFHKQAGIIEDRLKFGRGLGMTMSKHGIVIDKNGKVISGLDQYRKSINAYENFQQIFRNLGCVIVQDI